MDFNRLPDWPFRKETVQVIHALNIGVVDGYNQVPHLQAGTVGRTPAVDGYHFSCMVLVRDVPIK